MPYRAFLSHSSVNKPLVEEVANLLGRDRVFLDKYDFKSGMSIADSINKYLDESDIFVFFASIEAIDSAWVRVELERVKQLRLQSKILTYIIDPRIKIEDIPDWLKEYKIYSVNLGAYAIYLDIREHLKEASLGEMERDIFIGRTNEIEMFESARYDRNPKKVFLWNGLSGIGRRSIIKNIAKSRLNIKKYEMIPFKKGEDLRTILLRVCGIYKPKNEIIELYENSQRFSRDELIKYIADELHDVINEQHIFPIFIDDGGLMNDDGYIYEDFGILFDFLDQDRRQPYFFAAVYRKPRQSSVGGLSFVSFRVEEFSREDAKKLINARMQVEGVQIPDESYDEIVEMTRGNPELIVLAVKDYKLSGYISQSLYDQFIAYYSDYLSRYMGDAMDKTICRPLIEYETLPLEILQDFTKIEPIEFEKRIENLVSLSIIRRRDKWVTFSPSLINTAKRNNYLPLSSSEKLSFSGSVFRYLKIDRDDRFSIHLLEIFFEASTYSDAKLPNPYPFLKTSAFTLLESYFISRKYLKFTETYKKFRERVPEIAEDHSINYQYITSLINTYNFELARSTLDTIKLAPFQIAFLRGLLSRKEGKWQAALENFLEAERLKYRGAALLSELARANLMLNNYEDAMVYVERFRESYNMREDSYSLDIAIQANYRMGNFDEVDRLMEKLNLLDKATFLFRSAYISYEEGYFDEAYRDISECLQLEKRNLPEYNIHSLMIKCCLQISRELPFEERGEFLETARNSLTKMSELVKQNFTLRRYESAILALMRKFDHAKQLLERDKRRDVRSYNSAMLFIYEVELAEKTMSLSERKEIQANVELIRSSGAAISSDLKDIVDNRFTHMKE